MKNRIPFAALTFAFTCAGAALGWAIHDTEALIYVIFSVAGIGGFAAALSGDSLK